MPEWLPSAPVLGSNQKEIIMREKFSAPMMRLAIAVAAGSIVISAPVTRASAQASPASGTTPATSLKTPWGEPDLQGIWTENRHALAATGEVREPGSLHRGRARRIGQSAIGSAR